MPERTAAANRKMLKSLKPATNRQVFMPTSAGPHKDAATGPSGDVLALTVGGRTIGENLQRVIASGAVLQNQDGTLEVQRSTPPGVWLVCGQMPDCAFLNRLMFQHVYAQAAVPKGCASCYKVKVLPRTLRQLVALLEIARQLDCPSKCGLDFYNRHSCDIYAGYFYLNSLDDARRMFGILRALVDQHPKLGSDVPIVIKRGCSNYEIACGPSDKYTFKPELEAIETYFKAKFRPGERTQTAAAEAIYGTWVPFAYQIGDDTYLDFTNGKPLYPKTLTYDLGDGVPSRPREAIG